MLQKLEIAAAEAVYVAFLPIVNRKHSLKQYQVRAISEEDAVAKALFAAATFDDVDDDRMTEAKAWLAGKNTHYPIEIGLDAIERAAGIELECTSANGYCVSYSSDPFNRAKKRYGDWEKEIASPFLEAQGYKLEWCWVSDEEDSCGPLIRSIKVSKDGLYYNVLYG
jgi:hypothetical protein